MKKMIDRPSFAGTSTLPLNTDSRCRRQLEFINDQALLHSAVSHVGEEKVEAECMSIMSEALSSSDEKSKHFKPTVNKEEDIGTPLWLTGELKKGESEDDQVAHSAGPMSKKRRKKCDEHASSSTQPRTMEEDPVPCVKVLVDCDKADRPVLSVSDLIFDNCKRTSDHVADCETYDRSASRVSGGSVPSTSAMRNRPEYMGSQQREDEYEHVVCGLIYCASSFPGSSIDMEKFNADQIEGCKCIGVCSEDCTCIVQFGQPYRDGKLDASHGINPIFECNDECGCDECCPNRLVQKGPLIGLEITLYAEKGFGVRTIHFIPKYTFVCEYAGELISIQEAQNRFAKQKENESNYILVMREHFWGEKTGPQITIIDPTVIGNLGRYLNHSCNPNLIVVPVRIDSMVPVAALFAIRDIHAGEELCYDYDSSNDIGGTPQLSASTSALQKQRSYIVREELCEDPQNYVTSVAVGASSGDNIENVAQCRYEQQGKVMKKMLNIAHGSGHKPGIPKPCLCGSENCKVFLPVNYMLF